MHFLILRAIETRGRQISLNETQTSYGLSVLSDEEDRMCSSCSTRDPMQVRVVFLPRSSVPLWYHVVLINFAMTLSVRPHTICDVFPCGLTHSPPVGRVTQPMRET